MAYHNTRGYAFTSNRWEIISMFEVGKTYMFKLWTPDIGGDSPGGAMTEYPARVTAVSMPLITCIPCYMFPDGSRSPAEIINAHSVAFISATERLVSDPLWLNDTDEGR